MSGRERAAGRARRRPARARSAGPPGRAAGRAATAPTSRASRPRPAPAPGRPSRPAGPRQRVAPVPGPHPARTAGRRPEVDAVAGTRRERRQQQRGVHRGVEPGHVVDPARRGPRGVEDQQHPAVALGLPGAHHDVRLRAVARQSMLRTSSPRTYSRSESNSVPWPRTRTAARPSSSRSLASRLGRCLRDGNGGSTRSAPGTSTGALPCRRGRAARAAHGDAVGAQVAAAGREQRVVSSDAARRRQVAAGAGCRARRPTAATRRAATPRTGDGRCWSTTSVVEVGSPCRTWPTSASCDGQSRCADGAQEHVDATSSSDQPAASAQTVLAAGRSTTGADAEQQQQRHPPGERMGLIGGPAPSRARWPAPARPRRPRARPPGAARAGAPAWRGPAP